MKKNKLKFTLGLDWLLKGTIDSELKEYILLDYFQKLNKDLEEMKIYPMFTEVTLHLANVKSIVQYGKIIYTNKELKEIDDEYVFEDLKTEDLPNLTVKERAELEKILEYSLERLENYFDVIKSMWTLVYDTIEIVSIYNEKKLESKKGYFFIKSNDNLRIWEYSIKNTKGTNKITFTEKKESELFPHIVSKENEIPVFHIHCDKDAPFNETILPLIKRKVQSYVFQSKNITTT
jgi:hypothetical protein